MRLVFVSASAAVVLALVVAIPKAQQQPAGGAFTPRQAEAGRTAYDVSCAGCHGANLTGSSDAPPLTGPNFSNAWGSRPVNQLFRHIMDTMPPGSPGSLGEEVTLNVVAYLLQRMGGSPGSQDLTIKTPTTLNAALSTRGGGPPSMAVGAGTGSGQGRGGATSIRGVTIRGEVKNYVPVTPEMLKNPPAGDWLIFRRNYLGHSYSPLDQITRDNVQNLQLAWVWAMNDYGRQSNDAHRAQRHHLSREPQQHRPGARRENRRPHLGNARRPGSGARLRRDPEHRDRAGQSVSARRAMRTWSR